MADALAAAAVANAGGEGPGESSPALADSFVRVGRGGVDGVDRLLLVGATMDTGVGVMLQIGKNTDGCGITFFFQLIVGVL